MSVVASGFNLGGDSYSWISHQLLSKTDCLEEFCGFALVRVRSESVEIKCNLAFLCVDTVRVCARTKPSAVDARTVFPKAVLGWGGKGIWHVLCAIDLLHKTNATLLKSCSSIRINEKKKKKRSLQTAAAGEPVNLHMALNPNPNPFLLGEWGQGCVK